MNSRIPIEVHLPIWMYCNSQAGGAKVSDLFDNDWVPTFLLQEKRNDWANDPTSYNDDSR